MAKEEPLILISNDDGIAAPGIRQLVEAIKPLGRVVVVAPDSPQSGMGHAVTISMPLRLRQVEVFEGVEAWECSGTPADCVKLARDQVLHRRPDFVFSGINHGSNSSVNVLYSGTMSAAIEAAIEGIPAMGFSLLSYQHDADMSSAGIVARKLAKQMIAHELPPGSVFNVNIPYVPLADIKGVKVQRQAKAKWEEEFEERTDPHGRKYFWMVGNFKDYDNNEDTDLHALKNNYVSVVPVTFDLTDYKLMNMVKDWETDEIKEH